MHAKLRAAQLQTERDEHMLSIRKLQATNRVLRGSGKELLALASPKLTARTASGLTTSPLTPSSEHRRWAGSVVDHHRMAMYSD